MNEGSLEVDVVKCRLELRFLAVLQNHTVQNAVVLLVHRVAVEEVLQNKVVAFAVSLLNRLLFLARDRLLRLGHLNHLPLHKLLVLHTRLNPLVLLRYEVVELQLASLVVELLQFPLLKNHQSDKEVHQTLDLRANQAHHFPVLLVFLRV